MRAFLVVLVCVSLSAAAAAFVIHTGGPSTSQLDADIKTARGQLEEANAEVAKYSGGLIVVEAQLRASVLKNTIAMLEQKRESFLRGLTIVYRDTAARTIDQDANSAAEMKKAEAEALAAHIEAEQFSGGLVRSMALVREATAKATLASIEQRIELARSGIPLPTSGLTPPAAQALPGKPASDKDAL